MCSEYRNYKKYTSFRLNPYFAGQTPGSISPVSVVITCCKADCIIFSIHRMAITKLYQFNFGFILPYLDLS